MASLLFDTLAVDPNAPPPRKYWDKACFGSFEEQQQALAVSHTCYVGNLSYHTPEEYIYELARQAGPIKRIIMGLNRVEKTPCGFAFVEYFSREHCIAAQYLLTGKTLEGRAVKFELDPGFKEGRQYGRGKGGGQIRDDLRSEFDSDRGGYGALVAGGAGVVVEDSVYPPPVPPPSSLDTNMTLESSIHATRRITTYAPPDRRNNRRDRSRDPAPRHRYPAAPAAARKVDEFGRDLVDDED